MLRHLICFIDAEPGEAAARRPECARAHSRRRRYGRMAQIAAMHESASGPSVWTGRALQAESDDLEVVGLALLYPALARNVCVPGHHGYPRALDLIRVSAPKAIWAT